jgi:uncharacterized protein YceK
MKKFFLLICVIFILSGCGGTRTIQYAGSAPEEKLCTLYISSKLTITKFDNESVKWESDKEWSMVRIPEGSHTFVADYESSQGYRRVEQLYDLKGKGNFVAGRTYHMFTDERGSSAPYTLFIGFLQNAVLRIEEGKPPRS